MKAAEAAVRSKMGDEPLPAYVFSEMVRLGCEVPYGFDAVRSLPLVSCAALSPPCHRPECQSWCWGVRACPRRGACPARCPPSVRPLPALCQMAPTRLLSHVSLFHLLRARTAKSAAPTSRTCRTL